MARVNESEWEALRQAAEAATALLAKAEQDRAKAEAIFSWGDYNEPEVRKLLTQQFGVTYGRPSIYITSFGVFVFASATNRRLLETEGMERERGFSGINRAHTG